MHKKHIQLQRHTFTQREIPFLKTKLKTIIYTQKSYKGHKKKKEILDKALWHYRTSKNATEFIFCWPSIAELGRGWYTFLRLTQRLGNLQISSKLLQNKALWNSSHWRNQRTHSRSSFSIHQTIRRDAGEGVLCWQIHTFFMSPFRGCYGQHLGKTARKST